MVRQLFFICFSGVALLFLISLLCFTCFFHLMAYTFHYSHYTPSGLVFFKTHLVIL
jgi:hypothetical protein